jgi:hypothetical protein
MKKLYCVKCLIDVDNFNDPNGLLRCLVCGGEVSNVSYLFFRDQVNSIKIQREITNLIDNLMVNINSFIFENETRFVLIKASKSYVSNLEKHLWSLKTNNNFARDRVGKFANAHNYYGEVAIGQYNDPTLDQLDKIMRLHKVLGTSTKTDSIIKPFYYPSYTEIIILMDSYMQATYPNSVLPKRVICGLAD